MLHLASEKGNVGSGGGGGDRKNVTITEKGKKATLSKRLTLKRKKRQEHACERGMLKWTERTSTIH